MPVNLTITHTDNCRANIHRQRLLEHKSLSETCGILYEAYASRNGESATPFWPTNSRARFFQYNIELDSNVD